MATVMSALQRLTVPPTQTLRTLQPTPATVCYTVSTRPGTQTAAAKLRFYVRLVVRLLVALGLAALLWTKWCTTFGIPQVMASLALAKLPYESALLAPVEALPWRYLAPVSLLVLYMVLRRGYQEESLTVLRGLGLQVSTASSLYLRTPTTSFIPTTSIQDLFVHEAFTGFQVRFYLAIVVRGEDHVVVVFPTMLPRRDVVEEVWRGSKACLWERLGPEGTSKQDTASRAQ